MGKLIDLTGQRFGKLVVIGLSSTGGKNKPAIWNCKRTLYECAKLSSSWRADSQLRMPTHCCK